MTAHEWFESLKYALHKMKQGWDDMESQANNAWDHLKAEVGEEKAIEMFYAWQSSLPSHDRIIFSRCMRS